MGNRGQTLLESLIALAAIVIILGAISTAVLISVNNASYIKHQNQANKLAQQGMEYIRDQINNGGSFTFNQYKNNLASGAHCLDDFTAVPVPNPIIESGACSGANLQGIFKREVTFVAGECNTGGGGDFANGLRVTIDVKWTSGKCTGSAFCHDQAISSCFVDPAQALPAGGNPGI
ncbi:MAG: type IV pilus modification PilV family protein [Candidatus Levyibacteriota bacterium]